jgi:hypothetical protein
VAVIVYCRAELLDESLTGACVEELLEALLVGCVMVIGIRSMRHVNPK